MSRFERAAWDGVSAAALSDAIGRGGAMVSAIRRLCGGRLVGPAHTIQTGLGDSSTIHRGLQSAPQDSVIVVDAQGSEARAVWGAVLSIAAIARGATGVVVDGVVRDLDEMAALDFTVFARGSCPAGPHKGFRGTVGVPVSCGGVLVRPGDIVVGDADGVTVVPAEQSAATLEEVERIRARERGWVDRIEMGESTVSILGLDLGD
jgi:4-hydroxy-4-methyl-2-oxoglutarate aldolase